ncbi:MAG: TlpA family protein disulfide reductase [Candidatus Eremiobacteraeota bacterium]|nr:TlpA family protein disulfide reductase [Candidatus Eremiobacteraeota bacterium]
MVRFRPFIPAAALLLAGAAPRPAVTVFDLADAVGRRAPVVTLNTLDGSPLLLGERGAKPTYVFLFASWCEPCRKSLPFVLDDYARYADRVRFVGVDVLEADDVARAALAKETFPFPVAIFGLAALDAVVPVETQVRAGLKYRIPTDFLIDGSGVVRFAWHGLAFDDTGGAIDTLPGYLAKLGIQ